MKNYSVQQGKLPKVSVVVPVYNLEQNLESCIRSLLLQSYPEFEVVVVDDGSTDNSYKRLMEFAGRDSRISLYKKENGGLSDARNFGIKKSTGEYAVFVDGDDIVSSNFIESLMQPILSQGIQMSICDLREISEVEYFDDKASLAEGDYEVLTSDEALCRMLRSDGIDVTACAKLAHLSFWASHPFPFGMVYEDLMTIPYCVGDLESIAHIPHALYGQLMRKGSITRQKKINRKQFSDYWDAIKKIDLLLERSEASHSLWLACKVRSAVECSRLIRISNRVDCNEGSAREILRNAKTLLLDLVKTIPLDELSLKQRVLICTTAHSPDSARLLFWLFELYKQSCRKRILV